MAQSQTQNGSTSLQALKENAAPVIKPGDDATHVGLVDGKSFNLAMRVAQCLSTSTIVPQAYRGNAPNCLVALNMAARIGADPLMVMQNLYVVHGNPGWSSKFLIACFNQCGRFTALRYEFSGKEGTDSWGCRAWAVEKATDEKITGTLITIGLAKAEGWYAKNGSKWKTMPEHMLRYRAAAWLINTHAPEIAMGLGTAEEIQDTYDMGRSMDGSFQITSDELRAIAADDVPHEDEQEDAGKNDKTAEPCIEAIHCPEHDCVVRPSVECQKCKNKCPEYEAVTGEDL